MERPHRCNKLLQTFETAPQSDSLQPLLDVIELRAWDGIDLHRRPGEIRKDEDQIELFETELDTFEGRNFDVGKGDDSERRFGQVHQAVHCWRQLDIGSERNTFEAEFGIRDVHF